MSENSSNRPIRKKGLTILKILISLLGFYLALRMVNRSDLKEAFISSDKVLFALGFVFYVVSQLVSSERLRLFIRKLKNGYSVKPIWNAKVYWIGMAYNLFLPGGVGGDAYKIYLYQNKVNSRKRTIFVSLLVDRLTGLLAIVVLLAILALVQPDVFSQWYGSFWLIPAFAAVVILSKIVKKSLRKIHPAYWQALGVAFAVQILQVGSILTLAASVGWFDYPLISSVFLISSIATTIPVFLGGLGARELVFASLAAVLSFNAADGVITALLFSAITVIAAVPGLFLKE